ncbi:general transcription factor 2-related zinc finger protein [Actinidia rufa]|uniref:General transcription factor 2-related zinc finger protein n=1 Tax=Actinidia rufa TaxID=165716 RepID=A0A7J0DT67_9ERIC|nr:general transcription factor 2-related zinc finger protein [Actinidia rufa]
MAHEGDRKGRNILSFFKPKVGIAKSNTPSSSNVGTSIPNEEPPSKSQRVEFDDTNLERDPGLRIPIWQHPINQRDEVRRAYIKAGPYQPNLLEYPRSKSGGPTSPHNNAVQSIEGLRNVARHIDKVINAQSAEEIQKNRLRLKATIESVRWLSLQACAFRGHDESPDSKNRGNLIEMIKLMGKLNVEINDVVLEKAPKNAKYTSPTIQKEILHILANKIVHVTDTTALTLKKEISDVLARYNLNIENMRGQGYDGASNMRGAWNGLQALFLRDSPSAYYVHCFAHRLQLALVAAAENELQDAQAIEIERTVTTAERVTGRGANQIGTLHRAGTTRWSSHFNSICSLIDMYGATIKVLENMGGGRNF